jgi:hypothetical protein
MADNVVADAGAGGATFAAASLSFSGDTAVVPGNFVGILSGSEGSWTFSLLVGGAGAVAAGVQRVTLASDDPAVAALQIIDNTIYVDDADWTATTSSHALIGGVYQSTPGTITDGDTGPLRLTANGAAHVSVQNTVTVASHAVTNAGTFAVQAVCTNAGTFATQSVCTNAGTFAVQVDGNALTALQLIDNIVHVDDAAFTLGTHSGVMMMGFAGTQSVDANDAAALACTTAGALHIADAGGSITVDNGGTFAVQAACTNAGTFAVQVDGNALTALQKIDDPVLVDDAAFTPTTSSVMMAGFQADEGSTDSVDEGDAGAARMTLDRKVITQPQPHTTGGLSIFSSIDLDESEEEVKGTAGQIYGITAFNRTAAPLYLKLYNLTAANTTVGSSTVIATFVIPANADSDGAGFILNMPFGLTFDTAISAAVTTGVAAADTGAPGANDAVVNIFYK